ncbi:hypothetical protein LPJ56_005417 [Coemansia sp. RSA 2599]|nr:hypothetical protein LPJ75_005367 [Coemansia sp. RSA 2598]KAJ1812671.1 hypothetical protein LPJ56_005417 [Coemansia sp. RSA 2599]
MSDPFLVVQDDVISSFEQARTLLASWQRLNNKRRSPQEENEYQYMTDELHSSLKSIDTDLADLQETIDVARDFPEDYGLTPAKLADRQRFVSDRGKDVERMRQILNRPAPSQQRPVPSAAAGRGEQPEQFAVELNNYQESHQMMLQQQDQHFDAMLGTVRNLHGIASTMNTELDSQAILLDEVDGLIDRTQSKLNSAKDKVTKFLRDRGNRSLHIILILFAVILVLLVLIIFT